MDEAAVRELVDALRNGTLDADEVVRRLRSLPFTDLGEVRIDHHRSLRQGLAEAVYAPGKRIDHVVAAVGELLAAPGGPVLVTRASDDQRAALSHAHPGGEATPAPPLRGRVTWTVVWRRDPPRPEVDVVLATAGTADVPVAEECAAVLAAHGVEAHRLHDVGVAGLHRLLVEVPRVQAAHGVVVVAGMEGALASVIGGLTAAPVVAVPTSAGYGAGLEGVTALLAMLSSCAAGVSVVGIDNGYGAAVALLRALGARSVDRRERTVAAGTEREADG